MRRWLRRSVRTLAVLTALLAVAAAALWFGRHWVAERAIVVALDARGIPAALEVRQIDENGATLTDVRLGEDAALRADTVRVDYDPAALAEGRVESVSVDGAVLRVSMGPDGPEAGGLQTLLDDADADGSAGAAPPLPRVRLTNATVELAVPGGPAGLLLDATLEPGERGDFALGGTAALHSPFLTLEGTLEGGGSAGVMDLTLTFDGGEAVWPGGRVAVAGGVLEVSAGADAPAVATLELTGGDGDAGGLPVDEVAVLAKYARERLSASVSGAAGAGALTLDASGVVDLAASPLRVTGLGTARIAETTDALAALGVPHMTGAEATWEIDGAPRDGGMGATVTLDATAERFELPDLAARGLSLAYRGDVSWDDRGLTLAPSAPVKLAIEDAEAPGSGALDAPLALEVAAPGGTLARWPGPGTDAPVELDAEIAPAAFALTADGTQLSGELPEVRLKGAADAPQVTTRNGRIVLPYEEVALSDIVADFDAAAGKGPVNIGVIRHIGNPAAFPPAIAEGELVREGDIWRYTGTAWAARGRIAVPVQARHDMMSGSGRLDWSLAPLRFEPAGLQPGDVVPALAGSVSGATGSLSAKGSVRWGGGGARTELAAVLGSMSFDAGDVPIEGLDGTVRYDTRRPEGEYDTVTAESIGLGVPITGLRSELRVRPDLTIDVRSLDGAFAEGRVFAEDLSIDPLADEKRFTLQVEGVSLGTLLGLADLDGLNATGTLAGRIPVLIREGDVIIRKGKLSAGGDGTLVYKPEAPPDALAGGGEGVELMLQAFENFQYDGLTAEIDKAPGGETQIALHLSGRNPDLFEGQLFNFNINLSGNVTEIMRCLNEGDCGASRGLRIEQ